MPEGIFTVLSLSFESSDASASQRLLHQVLTCFRELLLLAFPFGDGDVINGDVALKPVATDALKHHLEIQVKVSVTKYGAIITASPPRQET